MLARVFSFRGDRNVKASNEVLGGKLAWTESGQARSEFGKCRWSTERGLGFGETSFLVVLSVRGMYLKIRVDEDSQGRVECLRER